jgi:hypothetical protein
MVAHDGRTTFGSVGSAVERARQGPWWRLAKLVKARLDAILLAPGAWKAGRSHEGFHGRRARPRPRPLQGLARSVTALQQRCQTLPHAA